MRTAVIRAAAAFIRAAVYNAVKMLHIAENHDRAVISGVVEQHIRAVSEYNAARSLSIYPAQRLDKLADIPREYRETCLAANFEARVIGKPVISTGRNSHSGKLAAQLIIINQTNKSFR